MYKGMTMTLAMLLVAGCGGMEEEFEVESEEQAATIPGLPGAVIPTCVNKCTLGTKRCLTSYYISVCKVTATGCTNWVTETCDHATESCSNGACRPSCAAGYTKVVNSACNPGSTPCFKCCSGKLCYKSPTCSQDLCPWDQCGCYHPGYTRATSCYLTYQYRVGWVWKCAMSDGSTCTYLYPSNTLLYCS